MANKMAYSDDSSVKKKIKKEEHRRTKELLDTCCKYKERKNKQIHF